MAYYYTNKEGYSDPTAGIAISAVMKEQKTKPWKPLVYICSPYAGNVKKNVLQARRYCRFAYEKGVIPLAPHLFFPQFMNDSDKKEREESLQMGLVLLIKCKELWVFGSASPGMKREIERAKQRNMTIRYFTEEMEEKSL